jgi:hypothetical protein
MSAAMAKKIGGQPAAASEAVAHRSASSNATAPAMIAARR